MLPELNVNFPESKKISTRNRKSIVTKAILYLHVVSRPLAQDLSYVQDLKEGSWMSVKSKVVNLRNQFSPMPSVDILRNILIN